MTSLIKLGSTTHKVIAAAWSNLITLFKEGNSKLQLNLTAQLRITAWAAQLTLNTVYGNRLAKIRAPVRIKGLPSPQRTRRARAAGMRLLANAEIRVASVLITRPVWLSQWTLRKSRTLCRMARKLTSPCESILLITRRQRSSLKTSSVSGQLTLISELSMYLKYQETLVLLEKLLASE